MNLTSRPEADPASAARASRARERSLFRRCLPASVVALAITSLMLAGATASAAAARSLVSSPAAAIPQVTLLAVSCPTDGFCMAIGRALTSAEDAAPVALSWNGRAWTARRFPIPAHAVGTWPAAVSCTSARYCIAVGWYGPGNTARPAQFAARWNGRTWTVVLTRRAGMLAAVSCSAYNACTAVGTDGSENYMPTNEVAERWNGRTWTSQRVPAFGGPSAITFSGVACTSATACLAVGSDWDYGDYTMPISARWTRGKWKAVIIRYKDPDSEDYADALSCSSGSACTAIGYSTDPGGDVYVPLAERWNGKRWGVQPVSGAVSFFGGLSCPQARMCMAVSGAQTELWNGTRWTVKTSVNPVAHAYLTAVACRSTTLCIGVGSVGTTDGGNATLAERWNGTTWVSYRTPAGPPTALVRR
jgi:hypothetical protein